MVLAGSLCTIRAFGSEVVSTIVVVLDYAGAWQAERRRCHRLVYGTSDGHPVNCQEPPVKSGWRNGTAVAAGTWWTPAPATAWNCGTALAQGGGVRRTAATRLQGVGTGGSSAGPAPVTRGDRVPRPAQGRAAAG